MADGLRLIWRRGRDVGRKLQEEDAANAMTSGCRDADDTRRILVPEPEICWPAVGGAMRIWRRGIQPTSSAVRRSAQSAWDSPGETASRGLKWLPVDDPARG